MTQGLRNLLLDIAQRDTAGIGVSVKPSNDRATAVRLGLIKGWRMKVGHSKHYTLTAKGREAIGEGI